jgi:acetoacetyl-CoA synthetase
MLNMIALSQMGYGGTNQMSVQYKEQPIWSPSLQMTQQSNVTKFMTWLLENRSLSFENYEELWAWSVEHLEDFWGAVWEFADIHSYTPYSAVLRERKMPGAEWFPGATLNYVDQVFRHRDTVNGPAIIYQSEVRARAEISWDELYHQVCNAASALREMGVQKGDRVAAYTPNLPETIVAFLATASIGAIWSSCSTDFGSDSVLDRLRQIEPKVLVAADGYRYNGKNIDRRETVSQLVGQLPSVTDVVEVSYLFGDYGFVQKENTGHPVKVHTWQEVAHREVQVEDLQVEPVPFNHPLWILYSSGTTGLPKGIVQGHGGIMMEHVKTLLMQIDLKPEDRFFWFTTTGWMMWNFLVGGLLVGATVVLYDGSPSWPTLDVLWNFADEIGMKVFGTSAAFIGGCQKAGLEPGKTYRLPKLKAIGSTGSPLTSDNFDWVYRAVKPDIWLGSTSGGTDVCTAFVGPAPTVPVWRGRISCRFLGADIRAYDEAGHPCSNQVGELVIRKPMPSMPLYFINDPDGRRMHDAYFDMYPGVWRHGDWIEVGEDGTVVIYGRSDSTINRNGIRMGTSELYRVVEGLDEVVDSLVVDVERADGSAYMPLFVLLQDGVTMSDELKKTIRREIREKVSARHVPDDIIVVDAIPRTLNGKKMEVPIKKILKGWSIETAINVDSMGNPDSIQPFIAFANQLLGK